MKKIECILFDCMETIVDIEPLPTVEDYAHWAYDDSGVIEYWDDFAEFFTLFKMSRSNYAKTLPEHKEYELSERFEHVARMKFGDDNKDLVMHVKKRLYDAYWKTYKHNSFVQKEVQNVLAYLASKYPLGIVSNFMVAGGVEELLEINNVSQYFSFVVTSINEGWKKPHPYLYKKAMESAQTAADRILFIGDDYINDYEGPRRMGMKSILLDRKRKRLDIEDRISNFDDLKLLLT